MELSRDFKDFYYDVQCRGYYPSYKLKALERQNVHLNKMKWRRRTILRNGTVDFISFSYYNSSVVSTVIHKVKNKQEVIIIWFKKSIFRGK